MFALATFKTIPRILQSIWTSKDTPSEWALQEATSCKKILHWMIDSITIP